MLWKNATKQIFLNVPDKTNKLANNSTLEMWETFRDNLQINEWKLSQVGDWSSESIILQEPANKYHATDQIYMTLM